MVGGYSLFAASIHEGFGRSIDSISPENAVHIMCMLFFLKGLCTSGATLTRLSIAMQLLPFRTSTVWKANLWGIISLEVVSLAAAILYWFLSVQPISANWDGSDTEGRTLAVDILLIGKCMEKRLILLSGWY